MSSPPLLAPGVWPTALPEPDRDSYAYITHFGLARTEFTGGFKRQRRLQYGQPSIVTLTFRMNTFQLSIFHAFLEAYVNLDFRMDLVLPAAWYQNIKRDCLEARVRFVGDPSTAMLEPDLFRVSIPASIRSMLDARYDPNEPARRNVEM